MASPADLAVGIDVAKQRLDVAVHPTKATWTVPRTLRRPAAAARRPDARCSRPASCWKPRAGTSGRVVAALPGLPVVVVNPRQTHHFARALGLLAKDDRIDAGVLARFAADVQPPVRPPPSKAVRELQRLSRRRRQLVKQRVTEQQQRRHLAPAGAGGQRRLAGRGDAPDPGPGPGPGRRPAGGSAPADPRRLAAKHPRHRPGRRRHLAGRGARTRRLHAPGGRRPGRRGALQPRQRRLAGPAPRLGWAAARSARCCTWPP